MKTKTIRTISILIVLLLLLSGCGKGKKQNKDYVILDCDMGWMNDDTLALSMLLQAEEEGNYEFLGITLEGGNFFIEAEFETAGVLQTCEQDNTRSFLESIGRTDVPVYKGTDYPIGFDEESLSVLDEFYKNADYIPFNDDYGAIHAFRNTVSGKLCDSDAAVNFLTDSVKKHPGQVIIISVGPTMNIAKAVEKDPAFAENVKAVYYMCGALGTPYEAETTKGNKVLAVGGANVTPYSEYNALYDPTALFTCFTAGFRSQYLTTGELTVQYDENANSRLKEAAEDSVMAAVWSQQYEYYVPDYPYWDPVTAFAYLRPDHITEKSEIYITVNTDRSDDRFGETVGITESEYEALTENEKSGFGKITVIDGVENFWDETIALLGK